MIPITKALRDPLSALPTSVSFNNIFPHLNIQELIVVNRVCSEWLAIAKSPAVWRRAIYQEIAFSKKRWLQLGLKSAEENMEQEHCSLPLDIAAQLKRWTISGKIFKDCYVLLKIPKEMTLKNLGELALKFFPKNTTGYREIHPDILNRFGDQANEKDSWVLIAKKIVDGSLYRKHSVQTTLVTKHYTKTPYAFEVPKVLETAAAVFAEYVHTNKRLFYAEAFASTHTSLYTTCQENIRGAQITIGGFTSEGFCITLNLFESPEIGVTAMRRL